MTDPTETEAPPYRWAGLTALVVLAGYLASLAPSVTWWDAGEFITAARTLGIPHPPGTPLFVLIAHLWGFVVPFGEYAARLNVLSALFSAVGAGALFLVAHASLAPLRREERWLRLGGAGAAALAGAFTYTQWLNSNETEVYAVAVCTISVMAWLALVWRRRRRQGVESSRLLLLILYLAGLSIGCHLLALLAGPAIVAFVWWTFRAEPNADETVRRREWAIVQILAGAWFTLIGVGLGSNLLVTAGGVALLGVILLGARRGAVRFGLLAVLLAAIGVTVYYAAYVRAGLHPPINEAQPDNWNSLLAVIRRAQYPVRTPLDNPMELHGPGNTGRTFTIFAWQLANYAQYFDWQWANGWRSGLPVGSVVIYYRLFITLFFLWAGIRGFKAQRVADRGTWCLCTVLFLTTGLALLLYMNFKIGYSLGYASYPSSEMHEVRDRDYFFVMSFIVWAFWAGLGLTDLARQVLERTPEKRALAGSMLAIALVPFILNFSAATRRHAADERLPGDFAYDLLNSVPPYGILITYGDNDTFPLWWAQEVAGIRRDVTVLCLALGQTDWYMRQIRDRVPGEFDEAHAPAYWQGRRASRPTWPAHTMTDQEIANALHPVMLPDSLAVQIGPVHVVFPPRTVFYPNDFLVLRVLQQNLGRRPVAWALTAADNLLGLAGHSVQRGLVISAEPTVIDSTTPGVDPQFLFGVPLDVPATQALATLVYRYGGLLEPAANLDDASSRGIAANLAVPWTRLAAHYDRIGNADSALAALTRAGKLSAQPGLEAALAELRLKQAQGRAPGQVIPH